MSKNRWKIGRRWHRFWLIYIFFGVGRRLFRRSTQLLKKVSLTDDFQVFFIGEASGDGRPTFWRNLHHGHGLRSPNIERQSADDRQTVGCWHFLKELSADRRRISTVILPMIRPTIADHLCNIVYNACFDTFIKSNQAVLCPGMGIGGIQFFPVCLWLSPNGIRGHLVFFLSVCHCNSMAQKTFDLGRNFWTVRDRDFILGM